MPIKGKTQMFWGCFS
jgi:hypothetical protein